MLYGADRLAEVRVVVTGEIEEAEQVAVADVEEEVARPGVVPVLHELHEGETQRLLVEPDGLLDVAADQREVVDAAGGRRRTLPCGAKVGVPERGAAFADGLELRPFRLWHGRTFLSAVVARRRR